MGQGICNAQLGVCDCFPGYAGKDCEQCAGGFQLSAHGTCDVMMDACQSTPTPCDGKCSGNGQCMDGSCYCHVGFFGRECAESGCPDTWSPDQCKCCPSGIVSSMGECCKASTAGIKPVLDRSGSCCGTGHVDGCGICGGTGLVLDKAGTCCPVRVFGLACFMRDSFAQLGIFQRLHEP
jgi:hypothetical protein